MLFRSLQTLVDTTLQAGQYSCVWQTQDCFIDENPIDGLYKFRLECFDEGVSTFCDSTYGYLLAGGINAEVSPYRTDENGKCDIDYKLPFPCLYCQHEVMRTDEDGNMLGLIQFIDQFKISACLLDSTGAVVDSRYTFFTIADCANMLVLNWEGMYTGEQSRPAMRADREIPFLDVGDGEDDNYLSDVYPNPFN